MRSRRRNETCFDTLSRGVYEPNYALFREPRWYQSRAIAARMCLRTSRGTRCTSVMRHARCSTARSRETHQTIQHSGVERASVPICYRFEVSDNEIQDRSRHWREGHFFKYQANAHIHQHRLPFQRHDMAPNRALWATLLQMMVTLAHEGYLCQKSITALQCTISEISTSTILQQKLVAPQNKHVICSSSNDTQVVIKKGQLRPANSSATKWNLQRRQYILQFVPKQTGWFKTRSLKS